MRLDKFITDAGIASRTEAAKAAKAGQITVNGIKIRKTATHIDPVNDIVAYCGTEVKYREFTYIMLNKPEGYVSATDDSISSTVLELLPEQLQKIGLFPCGRLDKNTLGLMLLTNNGPLAHKLLAPKSHVDKKYYFRLAYPLSDNDISKLEHGVDIGGYITAPCIIEMKGPCEGYIAITEGKYHQIKLMMSSVKNRVIYLERITFGPISLDFSLQRGGWRYLTDDEQSLLESCVKERKNNTQP